MPTTSEPRHSEPLQYSEPLQLAARFNGPPGVANGGVLAGLLAERVDPIDGDACEVTLHRPVPLEVPLPVVAGDEPGGVRLLDLREGDFLASARSARIEGAPPDLPRAGELPIEARTLSSIPVGERTCFVCGADRAPGDGLRIVPGPLRGTGGVAARFDVPATLPLEGGRLAGPFVWAILDCPGMFAVLRDEPGLTALLGRITARVLDRPEPGETCVVLGWGIERVRRRRECGTALYDAAGRLLAEARSTWIAVGSASG
ncbi:MAG: hypothetical protein QNK05_12405 [Myxococcota bacterium]|nr:hypothetical protein [Myxococcota bacterium]